MASSFDVCIVGAGLSGLSCAYYLKKLNPSLSIAVLEARDRVGGRTFTIRVGEGLVDVGGQWIGASQTLVRELVAELGLTLVPQTWLGLDESQDATSNNRNSFVADIPVNAGPADVSPFEAKEIATTIAELDQLALQVPTRAPWKAARAKEWDNMTMDDYLKSRHLSEVAERELRLAVQTILASEPRDLSFLYFLFFVHAAGGFRYLSDGPGGAQHFKVATGAQSICLRLADKLKANGVDIVLNCSVKTIRTRTHADGVFSTTVYVDRKDGGVSQFDAKRVVVAVPPPVAAAIDIFPGCSKRALLGRKMHMGAVIKTVCVYPKSFWTEHSATRAVDAHYSQLGPVGNLFDATVGDKPALVGLVVGDQARMWANRVDSPLFRAAVLQQYARMFANKKAMHPVNFIAKSWMEEPLSQGCYAAVMGKNVMTTAGSAMFEPVGAVHWAGTEAATSWNGYFEGAVQAGKREASGVAAAIAKQSSSSSSPSAIAYPASADVGPILLSKL